MSLVSGTNQSEKQVLLSCTVNAEPSRSIYATLIKNNGLYSLEKYSRVEEKLTVNKLQDTPTSPSFSSSVSDDKGLHASIIGLDVEASKKKLVMPMSKETDQNFGDSSSFEVSEEVDILSPRIDAPPGFTSRTYKYSSCAEISPIKFCLKTRSLVTDDVPLGFLEAPNLKDTGKSLGATFEESDRKDDILSRTLDAIPDFSARYYSHSSCAKISRTKFLLRTEGLVRKDAPAEFSGTPELKDLVRSQSVKFEAQDCQMTESKPTMEPCVKPCQVFGGRNTFVEHFIRNHAAVMIKKEDLPLHAKDSSRI